MLTTLSISLSHNYCMHLYHLSVFIRWKCESSRIMFPISSSSFAVFKVFTFLLVTSRSQVLERQESYGSCMYDQDCRPNSFCHGCDDTVRGKCSCLNGYQMTFRNITYYECTKVVDLGGVCENDIECQILTTLAFCGESNLCICKPEAQFFNGQCYETVKIGDICMSDGNCFRSYSNRAFCTNGRCTCRLTERPSADLTTCITEKYLGDACILDEDCSSTIPNTRCLERCVCATFYTQSRDETECVKAATTFGEPCDFDGQCSQFLTESICDNLKCTCSAGLHEYGDRCVITKKPGNSCNEDAECIYEEKLNGYVHCQEKLCMCIYGQSGSNTCIIEKTLDNSLSVKHRPSLLILIVAAALINFRKIYTRLLLEWRRLFQGGAYFSRPQVR